jgi:16S rRNA (cytosine1402-N4)-methyltransferase
MSNPYHIPVMLEESVEGLAIKPNGIYVDATFGGGGHSRAILEKLGPKGRLIAFDKDIDASNNLLEDSRLTLINNDNVHLSNFLDYLDIKAVDGIIADLGISSHQVDTPERGFSFRYDSALDMRMDSGNPLTAAALLNTSTEKNLQEIFSRYGEIKNSKTLAKAVIKKRALTPFSTTGQLADVANEVMPATDTLKKYLAPVFQSLRIAVNDELNGLKLLLAQCGEALKKGGRLVILTYHSLEDRIVKSFLQGMDEDEMTENTALKGQGEKSWVNITRKPIIANQEEIARNPRARSAKLRIAEKR